MCEWSLINRLGREDLMNVEKFREWCVENGGTFYVTENGAVKCVFPSLTGGVRERR